MKDTDTLASDVFLEFVEVVIHNILYIRNLYPRNIFVRRKIYGIPVQCSIHPEVNIYITRCLKGLEELLKKNEVKKVCLVILNKDSSPIEKFVFDLCGLYSSLVVNDVYLLSGEESFRAVLLKLALICGELTPLPEGSSFTIQIHTCEAAMVSLEDNPLLQNFPWIQARPQDMAVPESRIVPVSEVDLEYIQMELYLEESVAGN